MPSTARATPFAVLISAMLVASPGRAQEIDCGEPMTQMAMNHCAYLDWQEADRLLNDAYGAAMKRAKRLDADYANFPMTRRAGNPEDEAVTTEEMLRRAQRAWITYRDAACVVESDLAKGGSIQPLIFTTCAEELTRARTEALISFGDFD
ncbi:MAG: lysozyme inhibitor LprI family protein [Shimia sp.]